MIIEDGAGHGYNAEVNSERRLLTDSISSKRISYKSTQGDSYAIYTKHAIVAGSTDEFMAYLKYIGNKKLILSNAIISTGLASGYGVVEFFFNSTYTSGGNSQTAFNLNRTSANVLSSTIYHTNPTAIVGSFSGALEWMDVRVAPGANSFNLDFQDAIILGNGNDIGVQCKAPTIGDTIRVVFLCYEEDL